MPSLCTFRRRVPVLIAAVTLGVSGLRAQTLVVGYSTVANTVSPTVNVFTGASLDANTAIIIPFLFQEENFLDLNPSYSGNYAIDSISLLLAGNASLADFSLSVSSTLPTSLTPPSALVSFSATGTLSGTESAYTFSRSAAVSLVGDTTYYFRVGYTGAGTANWIMAGNPGTPDFGSGSGPTWGAIITTENPSDAISYRSVTSSGFSNDIATVGAFSITATAVSAVPEPAAFASLIGVATLGAALFVRRRRNPVPTA